MPGYLTDVTRETKTPLIYNAVVVWFTLIHYTFCQHDNDYIDGRSQIQVHTDEWTQVHSAQFSLEVTHPSNSANQGRRAFTSMNVPLS